MSYILVIEDNKWNQELFKEILETAGHKVVIAGNGVEGIRNYQHSMPKLVVTDIIMPEMDGIEVIHKIKRLTPEMPIIAMSGGGKMVVGEEILETASLVGANRVLKSLL